MKKTDSAKHGSLVTVIIPVFNVFPFLQRCIDSVLAQTWKNLEVITVDDGSSDGSGELLDRLASGDRRLRVIHTENRGVSAARNTGLDLATGDYLTFVDGDDYISPNYIRRFVRNMEKHGAQMALCGLDFVDPEGHALQRLVPGPYERFKHEEWVMRISGVWCRCYDRELWTRSGLRFREGERGEDIPIALYFSASCEKIITIPSSGYFYVQHSGSAMGSFRSLKTARLPYQGMADVFEKLASEGVNNSRDFYEMFVLRTFTLFAFDLARGAAPEKKKELTDFIARSLDKFFPDYARNPLIGLWRLPELPFAQRAGVRLFVFAQSHGLLPVILRFL